MINRDEVSFSTEHQTSLRYQQQPGRMGLSGHGKLDDFSNHGFSAMCVLSLPGLICGLHLTELSVNGRGISEETL